MTQPQPQQYQPFTTECYNCDQKFEVGAATCVAFVYVRQIWFSWIWLKCPHCTADQKFFTNRDELARFLKTGCGQALSEYPPDEVVERFKEIYDIEDLPEKDLTWRQVQKLQYAHWELQHTDVLDELEDEEIWARKTVALEQIQKLIQYLMNGRW